MALYLVDTNIASAAIRGGHPGLDQRLGALTPDGWAISAITRAELRYGLELKPAATALRRTVEAFLATAIVAPWDTAAADMHGVVRARLRLEGRPIGPFDEMIAAHALALGAVMVTDNIRHFSAVEGLTLENWIAR